MAQLSSIQNHLVTLIEYFIDRQRVVLAAMRDLRPDIVMRSRGEGTGKHRAELTRYYYRKYRPGSWGEWHHRVHGGGCHLTHTVTNEVIGWDAGDLRCFDKNWFCHHLEWRLQHSPDEDLKALLGEYEHSNLAFRDFVFAMLSDLVKADVLSQQPAEYRYKLLTIIEPDEL